MLESVRPLFRELATAIVPETASLDAASWADLERIVEEALGKRPPALRRQLRTFIRLLGVLPVLRWGRTFRRLDDARRARFLRAVESSPLFLLRRGFWGLRTLILMGYYARPETYRALGYRADPRGWLARADNADR